MKKYSLILIGVILLIVVSVFPSWYMRWVIKKDADVIGEQKLESEKLLVPDTENQIYTSLLMVNEMLDSKLEETEIVVQEEREQYMGDILAQWSYLYNSGLCPAIPFDMQKESVSSYMIKKNYQETVFHKYTCEVIEISMENERAALKALYDVKHGVYYMICIQEKEENENEAYMEKEKSGIDSSEGLQILLGKAEKEKVYAIEITEEGEIMEEEEDNNIEQENQITLQENGKNNFSMQWEQEPTDVFFQAELQDKKAIYQLYVK